MESLLFSSQDGPELAESTDIPKSSHSGVASPLNNVSSIELPSHQTEAIDNGTFTQHMDLDEPQLNQQLSTTSLLLSASQSAHPIDLNLLNPTPIPLATFELTHKPVIIPAMPNLQRIVSDQLTNSYSSVNPLFSDFFDTKTYRRWRTSSFDLELGSEGLVGAPRTEREFVEWLKGGDLQFFNQHTSACRTLAEIDKIRYHLDEVGPFCQYEAAEDGKDRVDEHFLEWNLAGAIVDSGLVCLIGPRNSGKSHLLRRVLHKLTHKAPRTAASAYAFPRPILPLRVITLQALQTQDPFDLLLYVLEDLKALLMLEKEDEVIGQLKDTLERGMEHLGAQSDDLYQQSRLKLLREKYSEALNSLKKVIVKATQRYQLVIVLEDFDLLTGERQTFLYNLMDIISLGYRHTSGTSHMEETMRSQFAGGDHSTAPTETSTPITAVMVTSCLDSFTMLEKRVASRFPQRQIIFDGHQSLRSILKVVFQHLIISDIPLPADRQVYIERRLELVKYTKALSKADEQSGMTHSWQTSFTHEQIEELIKASQASNTPHDGEPLEANEDGEMEEDVIGVVNKDSAAHDLELLGSPPLLEALKNPESELSRRINETRKILFDWNAATIHFFSNMQHKVIKALSELFDFTTNVGDFFQVFLNALARVPVGQSPSAYPQYICQSIRNFIDSSSGRLELAHSCSVVQIMILIEMGRLEQQIHAGWAKSGNPFVDLNLPAAALAINLGTAQMMRGKRRSDGSLISGVDAPNPVIAARQDTLRLQFYHFDRVFHEYSNFVKLDTALAAFRLPKHIIRKEFEHLLALKLVQFTNSDRYHYQIHMPHVEPVSTVHQFLKCNISTRELEMVLKSYPEELPDALKHRVRI